MAKVVRRLRAAVRMGLLWGAAWFTAGMVLALMPGVHADVPFPLLFALLGFGGGILFSGLLVAVEGRRRFERMSLPRFAGWGAAGGALLSGVFASATALAGEPLWGALPVLTPVLAGAGAVCAAGALAVARRADARALPGRTFDADDVGLSDAERRELLGDGE